MQEDMYDMHGTPTMGRYDPKINSSSNILLKFSSANSSSYLFNYFIKNFKDTLFICDETLYSYYMSKSDYDDWSIFGSNGVNPI